MTPEARFSIQQVVPTFSLPSSEGETIDVSKYRNQKNLVLVFLSDTKSEVCRVAAESFKKYASHYAEENAEVLLIVLGGVEAAARLKNELSLPFLTLADSSGAIFAKFIEMMEARPREFVAVFVTDHYGAVFSRWIASQPSDLPDQSDIIEWLRFIQMQCPECGVSEWPW